MFTVFRKPKTFKLRALHRTKKFGVAGRSYQEVLRKGCFHFQLPVTGSRLCLYEDGTELTGDYFSSVPDNSELVLLTSGQTWQGYVSDIHHFLHAFHKPQAGLIQAARQLLSGEQAPLRQKLLADLLHTVSENTEAETRAEDPPWFEGLESRFKNKSGYLRYSCESRIRSYLREALTSVRMKHGRGQLLRVDGSPGQDPVTPAPGPPRRDRRVYGAGRCTARAPPRRKAQDRSVEAPVVRPGSPTFSVLPPPLHPGHPCLPPAAAESVLPALAAPACLSGCDPLGTTQTLPGPLCPVNVSAVLLLALDQEPRGEEGGLSLPPPGCSAFGCIVVSLPPA
ncbi:DNA fragmentation factor subunit beta isoform X2 [Lynx canadensis]|uniref:DNA fragmentation factor subunit beta isoform X2 n=1 Tax=Lynx canadensis TaxID=61383 RepID=UPI0011B0527E|nr:DNA fragmentation factor subunit beta isoform X2 [Lynx canadensis]